MSTTAPYGTWPSPITPGTITTRTVHLSQVRVDDDINESAYDFPVIDL